MESRSVRSLPTFMVVVIYSKIFIRCHLGKSIVYDTISNLSWSSDVRTHTILTVIDKLLSDPWPPSVEVGREVPEAVPEEDCVVSFTIFGGTIQSNFFMQECYSWEFGNFNNLTNFS